jgi:hypothetical protein
LWRIGAILTHDEAILRSREIASRVLATLKISPAAVHREMKMAEAWLHRELTQDSASA